MIFNFPPNAGNTGTAAYLAVFESVYRTLVAMKSEGYTVDLPDHADALREALTSGSILQETNEAIELSSSTTRMVGDDAWVLIGCFRTSRS